MFKFVFEKRTDNEFIKINYGHAFNITTKRDELGIKSEWSFIGKGSETRTYDKIPKHKIFDFLRKAFEECEWTKIKSFKFKNQEEGIQYVDAVYFDFMRTGYILNVLYHSVLDNGKESHQVRAVKNVSSLEDWIVTSINEVEVIEYK